MLDENFPTYRLQPSADEPLNTILYFTFNGSDPAPEYLVKRPSASASRNQYALALFDVHYASVIYGEVLVRPEWSQPTLSAAEARAQNGFGGGGGGGGGGSPPILTVPVVPDCFSVLLYNPDQSVVVRRHQGGWNRSDSWGFEIPERTFKLPSASQLDRETGKNQVSELSPKIVFHWKRDSRLGKDMTCYMSGRSVGGKKNKEPDITVAMYKSGKSGLVSIYEPNMARVEVEDRKGLEVVLLLSAIVVRDLYLAPRDDPFNVSASSHPPPPPPGAAATNGRRRGNSRPTGPRPDPALVSGGLGDAPAAAAAAAATTGGGGQPQAEIDAETRRLRAMVAEEERQRRERVAREEEEKTRRMLEREEEDRRRRRQAEVDAETERLRREYGVQVPGGDSASPALPPRHSGANMSGALVNPGGGFYGPPPSSGVQQPAPPARPNSVGPSEYYYQGGSSSSSSQQQQQQQQQQDNGRKKLGNPLGLFMSSPYSGPSAAGMSVSNFFGASRSEEEKRKKMQKKRSVHF